MRSAVSSGLREPGTHAIRSAQCMPTHMVFVSSSRTARRHVSNSVVGLDAFQHRVCNIWKLGHHPKAHWHIELFDMAICSSSLLHGCRHGLVVAIPASVGVNLQRSSSDFASITDVIS